MGAFLNFFAMSMALVLAFLALLSVAILVTCTPFWVGSTIYDETGSSLKAMGACLLTIVVEVLIVSLVVVGGAGLGWWPMPA